MSEKKAKAERSIKDEILEGHTVLTLDVSPDGRLKMSTNRPMNDDQVRSILFEGIVITITETAIAAVKQREIMRIVGAKGIQQ